MLLKSQKRKKKGKQCPYYRRWKHFLHWTGEKEQL